MSMPIDIGISKDNREAIADDLSRVLADTYTLYLTTHNYHWNVTGPQFTSLHAMFMEQYTEMWTAVDEIAERIRALGVFAPGSYSAFARLASVEPADDRVPPADEMVANLVRGHETVARTAREAFKTAEAVGDEPTADLLTQRMQVHEKTAWMLRAILERGA